MQIPFVDLKAQYQSLKPEIDTAIANVIAETAFIGGPYVKAFEESFAEYCGTKHAVGLSNGTDALRLALGACGVGPGDEVITAANTFIATTEAIAMVGAQVRFVDVEADTYNMDPSLIEAAITDRTKAIIPVHLYGRPAEMDPILAIARKHGLKVIGDAAQAHGSTYRGRPVATLADVSCFSFYPGKNLGAYGDAGGIATDDEDIAEYVRLMRNHGRRSKYFHDVEGFNCRLDGLQAAILSVKLPHLDSWGQKRREAAARYHSLLADVPNLVVPAEQDHIVPVYHLYVVRVPDRDQLQKDLGAAGIASGVHYPMPLHLQPAYAHLGLGEGSFPVTETTGTDIVSLPIFPELTADQQAYVAEHVHASMRAQATA